MFARSILGGPLVELDSVTQIVDLQSSELRSFMGMVSKENNKIGLILLCFESFFGSNLQKAYDSSKVSDRFEELIRSSINSIGFTVDFSNGTALDIWEGEDRLEIIPYKVRISKDFLDQDSNCLRVSSSRVVLAKCALMK